jgi:hypothetical protein
MAALPVNGIFRRPAHPAPSVVRPLFPSAIRRSDEKIRVLPEQPQELIVADPDATTKPLGPFRELSSGDQHRDKRPIGGNGSLPPKPNGFSDKYLHPTLAKSERDRLTMLWYYTRDIQNVSALKIISCFLPKLISRKQDKVFLAHLQDTIDLVHELMGLECTILGLVDNDHFRRLVTNGFPLAVVPRRESTCSHTINEPPGSVFSLSDMRTDWRFAESPPVVNGLRAYAGTQLRYRLPDSDVDVTLGSLCVASTAPSALLTPTQERALVRFSDMIVHDIVEHARVVRANERHAMTTVRP